MASLSYSENKFRILLLGDKSIGKYSYVQRLNHLSSYSELVKNDSDEYFIHVELDGIKRISIELKRISQLELGQLKYNENQPKFHGFIVMFDLTNRETYDRIVAYKTRLNNLDKNHHVPCILLGSKCDLTKDPALEHALNEIDNYCKVIGFHSYFEISSKTDINIRESIQTIIQEIIQQKRSLIVGSTSPKASLITTKAPNGKTKEYTLKILVIGDLGTGKTALIQRYVNNIFLQNYRSTIGTDIAMKKIQFKNRIINLHIWDIAGDERFGTMTHLFYRNAAGCLVIFDITRPLTLTNGAVKWKADFDKKVNINENEQVPCLLVGNKCDLPKEGDIANNEYMLDFCRSHKFTGWSQTSAKQNHNILETFVFLIEQILKDTDSSTQMKDKLIEPFSITINTVKPTNAETKCC